MRIWRKGLLPIILLCAIAALYGQFLWNPVVFDDIPFFLMDESRHQPIDHYRYSPLELRSLPYVTLTWGKAAFGLDMRHFRIENLLLHGAVVISLYFFLVRLFEAVYAQRTLLSLHSNSLAFGAALLFALHPVAVYGVGYLVQRTVVMATLFSLLAMLSYLHGSERNKSVWLWASVPFYYLAVFSKEHAIMLPAILVALTVLLHDDWQTRLRQRWGIFVAHAAIMLFVIAAKIGVLGSVYEPLAIEMLDAESNLSYPLSVLTQSWLFFKYAGLWAFPNPTWMSVDMREPFASSLWSPYLLALGAFIVWGVGAIWLLLRRGRLALLGFAMLFPWLMFMTEFSTVRIQESFVLYRSYLWAIGAFCALPLLLEKLDKKIASVIVVAAVLAIFPVSMERLSSFGHSLVLWEDAEKLVKDKQSLPGVYRIYHNRGTALFKLNKYDQAEKDFTRAIMLQPNLPYSYSSLGAVYLKKEEWHAAINVFTKSIEISKSKKIGNSLRAHYGRAMAYEALGETGKAQEDYRVTCNQDKMGCEKL